MSGAPPHVYKPLQIYHLNLPGVSCQRFAPADALQDHIYYYWVLKVELSRFDLEIIPDNAVDLVMSPELGDFSALYFPVAEKFTIALQGPVVYVGTCFRATMAPLVFDLELAQLKSLVAGRETTDALNVSALVSDLVSGFHPAAEFPAVAEQMDRYWEQRISSCVDTITIGSENFDHQRWLDVIQQSLGSESLQTIAALTGLSERQFRRISTQLFGLSPKKIQRVQRLQSAVRELFSADAGKIENYYYDDSHRIRELKKLTGLTPGDIRKMAEKYNQFD